MKKILLSLLVIFINLGLYSQSCKKEIDEFTGKEVISYGHKHGFPYYRYDNDSIYFAFTTYFDRINRTKVIKKGAKVLFKFKNNKILELYTSQDIYSMERMGSDNPISSLTYRFILSKAELKMLASSKITVIRYPTMDNDVQDYRLDKSFIKQTTIKFINGAKCILEHIVGSSKAVSEQKI